MQKIFLSHNSKDKPFVRQLAADLRTFGFESWIDEAEIAYGQSLIQTIVTSIEAVSLVIVVISKNSVDSEWVKKELDMSLLLEIEERKNFVIPLIIDDIKIPLSLRTKRYIDCTTPKKYKLNLGTFVEIATTTAKPRYLTAGQAFDIIRSQCEADGGIISVSQQGFTMVVGNQHLLLKNLIYRNAYVGASRFWVFEFFVPQQNIVRTVIIMDGELDKTPDRAVDGWATDEQKEQVKYTRTSCEPDGRTRSSLGYRVTTYHPEAYVFNFPDSQFICEQVYAAYPDLYENLENACFLIMCYSYNTTDKAFIWVLEYFDAFSAVPMYRFDCDAQGKVIRHGPSSEAQSFNQEIAWFGYNQNGDIKAKISINLTDHILNRDDSNKRF